MHTVCVRPEVLPTVSGGGGAVGLGEALEDRVRPLVKGGELERLEGADGQTGGGNREKRIKTGKTGVSLTHKKLS